MKRAIQLVFLLLPAVTAGAQDPLRDFGNQPELRLSRTPRVVAPVMRHDAEFDLDSVPLRDWLDGRNVQEIPWNIRIGSPALRMDQRMEVAYTASISGKDLNRLEGDREIVFVAGLRHENGQWAAEPKVVRHSISEEFPEDFRLLFNDWVFVRPGDYELWLALHHAASGKRNLQKRRVRVTSRRNDPLADIWNNLPAGEFPAESDREGGDLQVFTEGLHLSVKNRQPLRVELVSVLNPPEQWAQLQGSARTRSHLIVTALATLAQMDLAHGSVSITGVDVVRHEVPFEHTGSLQLDASELAAAFRRAAYRAVSVQALEARRKGALFLRDVLADRLTGADDGRRILIVVASAFLFERGTDIEPVASQNDCRCRVYHVRLRYDRGDMFDDIGRLLRPLRPRTFDIREPQQFRNALAAIIRDLETF